VNSFTVFQTVGNLCFFFYHYVFKSIPAALRSEAWVCGRSLAGIEISNPAGVMYVCLL